MYADETLLETTLRRAAADAAFAPEFYGTLMDSDVYVLGETEHPGGDTFIASADTKVALEFASTSDGRTVLPFFSSPGAIRRYIDSERNYLKLSVRTLFEIVKGTELILNPRSDYGKAFSAEEIEHLLATGVPTTSERTEARQDTRMLIGQPADYPTSMVEALTRFYAADERVAAGYLARVHAPGLFDEPTIVFGIDCAQRDYDDLSKASGTITSRLIDSSQTVAFCHVNTLDPETIADYMLHETKPYFRRQGPSPAPQAPAEGFQPARGVPGARPTFGRRKPQ